MATKSEVGRAGKNQRMLSIHVKNEALKLWLSGTPEADIATNLDVERAAIEACRLDERWHELRSFCDLAVSLRDETKGEDADDRAILLVDVIENIAGKLLKRGVESLQAKDLHKLVVTLKIARDVRSSVWRTRTGRHHARKERRERW